MILFQSQSVCDAVTDLFEKTTVVDLVVPSGQLVRPEAERRQAAFDTEAGPESHLVRLSAVVDLRPFSLAFARANLQTLRHSNIRLLLLRQPRHRIDRVLRLIPVIIRLGEFLALAASLEHLSNVTGNNKARVLAQTLDQATGKFLQENRSPSRKVGELDNRGSHFYLSLYWAEALAIQSDDSELKSQFSAVAKVLSEQEAAIVEQLNKAQGEAVEMGGYYRPDASLVSQAMRPSALFNQVIDTL